jgi:hypothetical protein
MRLRIFERQILPKIFGPIQIGKDIWRMRNNAELDQVNNRANIVRFYKAQRVKWLGHMQRMHTSRIVKRIFEWKPRGRRSLGRPRLRWLDDVCDDLKVLKVRNWKELATDRKACLRKPRPTKGCSANERRRLVGSWAELLASCSGTLSPVKELLIPIC